MARKSYGRRKIEIKKIEKKTNLHVTFSKRRMGLFKKASELSILCGVDVAVIVQSPAGKIFASAGQGPINSIIDRYLAATSKASKKGGSRSGCGGCGGGQDEEAKKCVEIVKKIKDERMKEKSLMENNDDSGTKFWWKLPVDKLGLDELEEYTAALEILKKKLISKAEEMARANAASSRLLIPNNTVDYFGGLPVRHSESNNLPKNPNP